MGPDETQDQGQDQGGMPPANDQGGMPQTPPAPTGDQGMPQTGDQGAGDQNGAMPSVGGQGFGGDTTPTNEPTVPGEQQPEEGGDSQQPPAPGM
jgi:hypothetical protein